VRQDLELTSFTKGELSPRLRGRTDYEGYFNGCETLLNMVVLLQGGATRRPGTLFSDYTKFQTDDPAGSCREPRQAKVSPCTTQGWRRSP
jgi:hypothetical protein